MSSIASILTLGLLVFINGVAALGPAAVPLGTAANFAILAKTGVSTVPASTITGAIGVSPAAGSFLTGFSLTLSADGTFASSTQVVGKLYAGSYTSPTPLTLTTANADVLIAYNNAAGRVNPDFFNIGAGAIGGLTLTPGLYKWTSGVSIGSNVILAGTILDVFIFQVAGTLTTAAGARVTLLGVLPKNVFWQVGGSITAASTSHLEGTLLGKTQITLQTGSSITGRVLAQTAVALQKAIVVGA